MRERGKLRKRNTKEMRKGDRENRERMQRKWMKKQLTESVNEQRCEKERK